MILRLDCHGERGFNFQVYSTREKALREVERYTSVEFEVLDEKLKSRVLTGRFRTGDVTALLDMLETNFGIQAEFDGEDRILLSSIQ